MMEKETEGERESNSKNRWRKKRGSGREKVRAAARQSDT